MTLATIRQGFETALKTWADAQTPAIPIAWPNVAFTPPAGRYVRSHVLPSPEEYLFFANTGREFRGIYQVSLCLPINTGSGAAETLAASMAAAFSASFTQSGLRIYLLRPFSCAPAITEESRYVVPVSTQFKAYTTE